MAVVTGTDQPWAVEGTPRETGWLAFASTRLIDALAMYGGFAEAGSYRGH